MQPTTRDLTASIGLLVLRLGVGGYMLTHGVGKVRMLTGGQYEQFDPLGIGPTLSVLGITLAEFVCASLVMIGLATRPAALVIVFAMGVAAFVVHGGDPWTSEGGYLLYTSGQAQSWASKEPALLYLVVFLALAFTGPGRFALDALIHRRFALRTGGVRQPQTAGGVTAA